MDILVYGYIYFFSLLLMIYIYKYLLILLILVEIMVVNIVLIILLGEGGIMCIEFTVIYYLVFRVCEGVLGLRLLVIVVRFSGRDLYYIFNIRKF